jgi:hypothetical protein
MGDDGGLIGDLAKAQAGVVSRRQALSRGMTRHAIEARRVRSVRGVALHLSGRLDEARHPARRPPRTRIEETMLDLAETAAGLDQAIAWLSATACRAAEGNAGWSAAARSPTATSTRTTA